MIVPEQPDMVRSKRLKSFLFYSAIRSKSSRSLSSFIGSIFNLIGILDSF